MSDSEEYITAIQRQHVRLVNSQPIETLPKYGYVFVLETYGTRPKEVIREGVDVIRSEMENPNMPIVHHAWSYTATFEPATTKVEETQQ